jgi:hypothetical protein
VEQSPRRKFGGSSEPGAVEWRINPRCPGDRSAAMRSVCWARGDIHVRSMTPSVTTTHIRGEEATSRAIIRDGRPGRGRPGTCPSPIGHRHVRVRRGGPALSRWCIVPGQPPPGRDEVSSRGRRRASC